MNFSRLFALLSHFGTRPLSFLDCACAPAFRSLLSTHHSPPVTTGNVTSPATPFPSCNSERFPSPRGVGIPAPAHSSSFTSNSAFCIPSSARNPNPLYALLDCSPHSPRHYSLAALTGLPFYKSRASLTPSESTLTCPLRTVDSKPLTAQLNPLESTLTRKPGGAYPCR